jgi:hypothetical protein
MSMSAEQWCPSEQESWDKGDVKGEEQKESRGGCTCITALEVVLDRDHDDTTWNSTGCVYILTTRKISLLALSFIHMFLPHPVSLSSYSSEKPW